LYGLQLFCPSTAHRGQIVACRTTFLPFHSLPRADCCMPYNFSALARPSGGRLLHAVQLFCPSTAFRGQIVACRTTFLPFHGPLRANCCMPYNFPSRFGLILALPGLLKADITATTTAASRLTTGYVERIVLNSCGVVSFCFLKKRMNASPELYPRAAAISFTFMSLPRSSSFALKFR